MESFIYCTTITRGLSIELSRDFLRIRFLYVVKTRGVLMASSEEFIWAERGITIELDLGR